MIPRTNPAGMKALALLATLIVPGLSALGDDQPAYDPTDRYEVRKVEGWSVLVNKGLLRDHPDLADRRSTLLRYPALPGRPASSRPRAVEALREVRIWVEEEEPHHPCMAYHPDAGWLREHDMNPEKARCVEVANARNFLTWTIDQPWMVLHELAHAYHHQVLEGGFENTEVRTAYDRAMAAKLYDSVLRIGGRDEKAYATTNPMEYFAEASEAFFGTNDFYPFVRPELSRHDPEMDALLGKLWHKR